MGLPGVGVQGVFRDTCEAVLHVLRKHKHTLAQLLECFAYDPLIDWTGDAHALSHCHVASFPPLLSSELQQQHQDQHRSTHAAELCLPHGDHIMFIDGVFSLNLLSTRLRRAVPQLEEIAKQLANPLRSLEITLHELARMALESKRFPSQKLISTSQVIALMSHLQAELRELSQRVHDQEALVAALQKSLSDAKQRSAKANQALSAASAVMQQRCASHYDGLLAMQSLKVRAVLRNHSHQAGALTTVTKPDMAALSLQPQPIRLSMDDSASLVLPSVDTQGPVTPASYLALLKLAGDRRRGAGPGSVHSATGTVASVTDVPVALQPIAARALDVDETLTKMQAAIDQCIRLMLPVIQRCLELVTVCGSELIVRGTSSYAVLKATSATPSLSLTASMDAFTHLQELNLSGASLRDLETELSSALTEVAYIYSPPPSAGASAVGASAPLVTGSAAQSVLAPMAQARGTLEESATQVAAILSSLSVPRPLPASLRAPLPDPPAVALESPAGGSATSSGAPRGGRSGGSRSGAVQAPPVVVAALGGDSLRSG